MTVLFCALFRALVCTSLGQRPFAKSLTRIPVLQSDVRPAPRARFVSVSHSHVPPSSREQDCGMAVSEAPSHLSKIRTLRRVQRQLFLGKRCNAIDFLKSLFFIY